jgi:serine/threonine protein phosphatase PrpC
MKINSIFDKGSSKEDAYFIKDNTFGVFDGFDSLSKFTDKNGRTGGLIAAEIARNEFSNINKSLMGLLLDANKRIKEKTSSFKIDTNNKRNIWGTTAAVIKVEKDSFEWIQIGDSLIFVIYKDNNFRLLVEDYDHDKEILEIWRKLANQKKENIRKIIDNDLAELRKRMNKSYGVLNGDRNIIDFIKKGKENLKDVKHILLFTDGLIIPKQNPSGGENWNTFVKLFLDGGLENISDFVRALEKGDPKCWQYPRFKQYDDIAAISVSFK